MAKRDVLTIIQKRTLLPSNSNVAINIIRVTGAITNLPIMDVKDGKERSSEQKPFFAGIAKKN
jgi:hypothetical protein